MTDTLETKEIEQCGECGDPAIFELYNGKHGFYVHLDVILKCLQIAEKEMCVPPIGDLWWGEVASRYNLGAPYHEDLQVESE